MRRIFFTSRGSTNQPVDNAYALKRLNDSVPCFFNKMKSRVVNHFVNHIECVYERWLLSTTHIEDFCVSCPKLKVVEETS